MASITNVEKMKLEKIFNMSSGYVLDFSNPTFADVVLTATRKNIFADTYAANSGSKANRLRAFWEKEPDNIVGKLLVDLLECWHAKKIMDGVSITTSEQQLFDSCKLTALRLQNKQGEDTLVTIESEEEFVSKEFKNLTLEKLEFELPVINILNQRIEEIRKCLNAKASLAVIFLCGSTLEGILLGVATKNPQRFNQAVSSPKKDGKALPLQDWKLSSLIDVSYELKLIQDDVRKHSHSLRDFRNYIHPYQQTISGFHPHEHTAKISWQVLQAAIYEITNKSSLRN